MNSIITVKDAAVNTENNLLDISIVDRFLKFAAVSENSVVTYKKGLKQLAKYFSDNGITTPARADLENWRDSLIDAGKSASTIQLYLSTTKLFFRWLAQEGIFPNIADNLKSRVKVNHDNHKKDALTEKQAQKLLLSVKGNDLKSLRDRAIIALLLTAGLRSVEICRANISDIRQLQGGIYLFVQGKGRSDKAEAVRIAPQVYKLIKEYLKARKEKNFAAPLFVSTSRRNKNARLETQSISRMVKENLREIGLDFPTITCHSLRHTAATIMLIAGEKLENVQMILRHKNIGTTMIYNNSINRYRNNGEILAANIIFRKLNI